MLFMFNGKTEFRPSRIETEINTATQSTRNRHMARWMGTGDAGSDLFSWCEFAHELR